MLVLSTLATRSCCTHVVRTYRVVASMHYNVGKITCYGELPAITKVNGRVHEDVHLVFLLHLLAVCVMKVHLH